MTCSVCNIPDDRPLYNFYNPAENDNAPAHADCGEDAGLEQEGSQLIN